MPPKPNTRPAARRTTFGDISIILISKGLYLQGSLLLDRARAVGSLWIRNEDVVAELILAGDEVFLLAFPFGDLIMTRGIAAENSRRLPGCVETLRRRYFKIVVENVALRQMDPFDDMHVAVIRDADRLADRDIGLRDDRDGVDDQRFAVPMPDRVTVKRQVGIFGMRPAVHVDSPHSVAVDFAQHGDA